MGSQSVQITSEDIGKKRAQRDAMYATQHQLQHEQKRNEKSGLSSEWSIEQARCRTGDEQNEFSGGHHARNLQVEAQGAESQGGASARIFAEYLE